MEIKKIKLELVPSRFSSDDEPPETSKWYHGFHQPSHRWNGWACPFFSEEVAHQMMDDLRKDGYRAEYHKAADSFYVKHQDDEASHKFEPVLATIDGEEKKLYSIGGFLWCWYVESEELEA